uniref:Sema domain, transmembrane domain (TM), and cytoplasmic domain, (semaphorin) 6D, like n=1 Tax=Cyprinus carpio TaxID=7962 RepID=A0A8C1JTF4_CYPCA
MGWRELTIDLLLLLLLVASHLEAVSFPEDNIPLDAVDRHYARQYPVFRGRPSGNESQHRLDFQLMTKIHDTLFIAGRDQVYLVSLRESYRNEIIPYRKLTWRSGQADRETCAMKGKHRDECHNFIKVLVPRNDDLVFICGTNGFNPMCRYYRVSHTFDGEEISGLARCPFDAKQTNVALFADGKLYSATVADFLASDAVIYRSMGDGSALRTIKYDSKWLKEPHFLHAVDYGDFVYFFFREIAAEHNNLGKAVYSRVARICKNDMGGSQRVLEKHWTSFVKARLNCSVPGESFFYFDVLQAITDIIDINGVPSVVGVFTTQLNSIPGSAVCAFSMADIEKAFRGRFKEQKTADSVWTPFSEDKLPKPRLVYALVHDGLIISYKTSIEFPDETLQFIKSHPLMDASVPSIGDEPWFTKTRVRYRLTALAVDNTAGPHKNYTVVFIGSEAGIVLKVLAKTSPLSLNDTILLEEIDVFNQAKCLSSNEDDRRILSFHLDKDTHTLYVAFSSCVVRIPLSRCERHSSCQKSCIASRDPYCGWMSHGACERIPASMQTGYEQDVEYGNIAHLGDCHGELINTLFVATDMELPSSSVTVPVTSEPIQSPQTIPTQIPQLFGSRKFVLHDDPATSHSVEHIPGVLEGVWEIQAGESNQMVHMNILISCVLAAFLLGAFIAGMVVYCYRDAFLRTPRKIQKDAESAQSCTDSTGSFAKLNGLFDSPVKEYQPNMDTPKLYTNLLSNGREVPTTGDTKTMLLSGQPPELAALPTPESTPVLQQKSLQPIKNQWERAHGKISGSRKDGPPKSPQYLPSSPPPHSTISNPHIPSAVVLPNATHENRASFSNPEGPQAEKKIQNSDQHGSKSGRKDQRRTVDARNTLNDLLKHLNDSNPKAIMVEMPKSRQHLMLEPIVSPTEIPPKVPSREASLYSPSSSLPRNSPTKRMDVPTTPTSPTGQMGTLERQRYHRSSSQRHSISSPPKGLHSPSGAIVSRQPSMNRGGYMPPTPSPPTRLDSHGVPMAMTPSVSRQSSYSGHGSLPRTSIKRTASLKPDVPPKPNGFAPQTAQMRAVNKYSY